MSAVTNKFNAAVAQRINTQTVSREGKAITRNELVESFFELVPTNSDRWSPTHHFLTADVNTAKPEGVAQFLMAISVEDRNEFVKTLDSLVRGGSATAEAKAFAQTVLQKVVGPEYRAWKPNR